MLKCQQLLLHSIGKQENSILYIGISEPEKKKTKKKPLNFLVFFLYLLAFKISCSAKFSMIFYILGAKPPGYQVFCLALCVILIVFSFPIWCFETVVNRMKLFENEL